MLLSELIGKNICAGKTVRGVCRGVGISPKTFAVKYLLCAKSAQSQSVDFSIGISAVEEIGNDIYLSRLRSVFPKNCDKIFLNQPVYLNEGVFLGNLADVELISLTATRLFTDRGTTHSALSIVACSDAVILKKEQTFPIGQRVPAPIVSKISDKNETIVTRSLLRTAMQNGALIRLTLSLAPFGVEFIDFPTKKQRYL